MKCHIVRAIVVERPAKGFGEKGFTGGYIVRGEFDVVNFFMLIQGLLLALIGIGSSEGTVSPVAALFFAVVAH